MFQDMGRSRELTQCGLNKPSSSAILTGGGGTPPDLQRVRFNTLRGKLPVQTVRSLRTLSIWGVFMGRSAGEKKGRALQNANEVDSECGA